MSDAAQRAFSAIQIYRASPQRQTTLLQNLLTSGCSERIGGTTNGTTDKRCGDLTRFRQRYSSDGGAWRSGSRLKQASAIFTCTDTDSEDELRWCGGDRPACPEQRHDVSKRCPDTADSAAARAADGTWKPWPAFDELGSTKLGNGGEKAVVVLQTIRCSDFEGVNEYLCPRRECLANQVLPPLAVLLGPGGNVEAEAERLKGGEVGPWLCGSDEREVTAEGRFAERQAGKMQVQVYFLPFDIKAGVGVLELDPDVRT
ncbi:hypothetical protein CKAH01_06275 [Colletotrichum kahawae]|uniref:Uncharacterized protein n=1 Tax=Colletotrichum kahawae TaxID=34407 RepID=A0AAD9YA89_COLKA|nr:hypothetical protein CKAH01_06275 [Colletotrichum kahawae]